MSKKVTLENCLEEVEARFLYNLPESEFKQVDRLFFQIEQAWWFYEDFLADNHAHLPHFKRLINFAEVIFAHCPLLADIQDKCEELFNEFGNYKSQIPVFGCIMMNPAMNKIALVCSWSGKSWGFPRGKVNEGESPLQCAIRETFEETGYDPTAHCKEEDNVVVIADGKAVKLYIAPGVPDNAVFIPQTRKEVSKVEFHDMENIPKSYGVLPFLPKLRRWLALNKKAKKSRSVSAPHASQAPARVSAETKAKADDLMNKLRALTATARANIRASNGQSSSSSSSSSSSIAAAASVATRPIATTPAGHNRSSSARVSPRRNDRRSSPAASDSRTQSSSSSSSSFSSQFNGRNADTFQEDVSAGTQGWGVSAMFEANAKLTGRQFSYDGNPHAFGSSHPHFVDYRAKDGIAAVATAPQHAPSSSPSSSSSSSSLSLLPPLPPPPLGSSYFPSHFKFDLTSILLAVDQSLSTNTSSSSSCTIGL